MRDRSVVISIGGDKLDSSEGAMVQSLGMCSPEKQKPRTGRGLGMNALNAASSLSRPGRRKRTASLGDLGHGARLLKFSLLQVKPNRAGALLTLSCQLATGT